VSYSAVIFDFDGVIADSEVHSNQTLADFLNKWALPTTLEDCLRDYYGSNWQEVEKRIVARLGRPVPSDFRSQYHEFARSRPTQRIAPVSGAVDFINAIDTMPKAIASSSSCDYIGGMLAEFGLASHFANNIYSADGWDRGKPHPDIYLAAAQGLGVEPKQCLAIEDSPTGAQSAIAAGMQVVGLCAATHVLDKFLHAQKLRAVGVHWIAHLFDDIRLES
jgi:HAD superfamily hydrolase (TIGR01509 family)